MLWHDYLFHFAGGLVFANGLPHFLHGISGEKFQSPFANPPGKGLSSPLLNVVWGFANFVIGYALVMLHAQSPRDTLDIAAIGLGVLAAGLFLGAHFGKVKGNN
jgi:hypothetical protein